MFKALSHFKFIFLYGERVHSNFMDFHAAVQLPQHHFVEETVFLLVYILASFVKDELGHRCVGLFLDSILFHWSVCVSVSVWCCFDYYCFIVLIIIAL